MNSALGRNNDDLAKNMLYNMYTDKGVLSFRALILSKVFSAVVTLIISKNKNFFARSSVTLFWLLFVLCKCERFLERKQKSSKPFKKLNQNKSWSRNESVNKSKNKSENGIPKK